MKKIYKIGDVYEGLEKVPCNKYVKGIEIVTNIFKEEVYGYKTTLIETEFQGMWEGRSGVRVRRIYKAKNGALLNEFF